MLNKRKTREERLQEIWSAAKIVFLEKGYSNATMEDIIHETELSKGGFYHYYGGKKEILIDMMRNGNMMYIQKNENMVQLAIDIGKDQKLELLLEALLDKFLMISEDKRLYMMFGYEIMYDEEIKQVFLELESDFLKLLMSKIGMKVNKNNKNLIFISRMANSLLFAQNLFNEPEILESKRDELKEFFRPMVNELL